ncbi:ninjurin-2-like [Tropilaelaps mercedesae]|uniref:Ninjurin-2-like n=1 Tax=Tropilaelaps mercedesae TaxID=418985 RepID=A0A1V9XG81_9ACAR|nr:ninjurin-2-like [Tropilaelaps mercedesae]
MVDNPKPLPHVLDANVYATKKSIAQGMLDVALLTANASQLKYILQVGNKHEFYLTMLSLISISIVLQCLIGLVLVAIFRFNINKLDQQWWANRLNNVLVWLVFSATLCNVFISAFGIDWGHAKEAPLSEGTTKRP